MTEMCLHLLTKMEIDDEGDPLDRIWRIDNWINSLDRVIDIHVSLNEAYRQRFSLTFDAGRKIPDQVEVERIRTESAIQVNHLVPPPGIKSLSAIWWCEVNKKKELFARRTMLMDQHNFSSDRVRQMFYILRENLTMLVGQAKCKIAN